MANSIFAADFTVTATCPLVALEFGIEGNWMSHGVVVDGGTLNSGTGTTCPVSAFGFDVDGCILLAGFAITGGALNAGTALPFLVAATDFAVKGCDAIDATATGRTFNSGTATSCLVVTLGFEVEDCVFALDLTVTVTLLFTAFDFKVEGSVVFFGVVVKGCTLNSGTVKTCPVISVGFVVEGGVLVAGFAVTLGSLADFAMVGLDSGGCCSSTAWRARITSGNDTPLGTVTMVYAGCPSTVRSDLISSVLPPDVRLVPSAFISLSQLLSGTA